MEFQEYGKAVRAITDEADATNLRDAHTFYAGQISADEYLARCAATLANERSQVSAMARKYLPPLAS